MSTTLAPVLTFATRIATDGTTLYYPHYPELTGTSSDIDSVPTSGGAVTLLVPSQEDTIAIAVDPTALYWLTLSIGGSNGQLRSCTLAGPCIPTVLADGLPTRGSNSEASLLFADHGSVFWNDDNGVHGLTGSTVTDYVQEPVLFFTVDATNVYWASTTWTGTELTAGIFHTPR